MDSFSRKNILKKQGLSVEETEDFIAVEARLQISVNGKESVSLFCTPSLIRELITGFLLTEEIIPGDFCPDEISITYGEGEITADIFVDGPIRTEGLTITSGCTGGITFNRGREFEKIADGFFLEATAIEKSFKEFRQRGELYRLTGCVHSAALSDGRKFLVFAEDIGRHNAVDKVIGAAVLRGIPFDRTLLLVSGRLSSEIATKCARWGIPLVASRTAPTALAVEIAEISGVTLLGFVRGGRMNIYTHRQRIVT